MIMSTPMLGQQGPLHDVVVLVAVALTLLMSVLLALLVFVPGIVALAFDVDCSKMYLYVSIAASVWSVRLPLIDASNCTATVTVVVMQESLMLVFVMFVMALAFVTLVLTLEFAAPITSDSDRPPALMDEA